MSNESENKEAQEGRSPFYLKGNTEGVDQKPFAFSDQKKASVSSIQKSEPRTG